MSRMQAVRFSMEQTLYDRKDKELTALQRATSLLAKSFMGLQIFTGTIEANKGAKVCGLCCR